MEKFIIDSNILIEFFKGNENAKKIIDVMSENRSNEYLLSIDTIEEVLYILVRFFSKKPYWELKNNPELSKKSYDTLIPLLDIFIKKLFTLIDTSANLKGKLFNLCKKFGLLPKDALLVALALEYKVRFIISLDKDLKQLQIKSIKIISSVEELREILND